MLPYAISDTGKAHRMTPDARTRRAVGAQGPTHVRTDRPPVESECGHYETRTIYGAESPEDLANHAEDLCDSCEWPEGYSSVDLDPEEPEGEDGDEPEDPEDGEDGEDES